MKTDDVKEKSKRVKRCYPRNEVYHRFVHDDTFIYSKEERYKIYVIGNYLLTGYPSREWGIKATNEDIANNWLYNKTRCIAIIDREHKRIAINSTYKWHYDNLIWAIPKDYEIFSLTDEIPVPSLSSTGELDVVIKEFVKYEIHRLCDRLNPMYAVLNCNAKTIHTNLDNVENYTEIIALKALVKKYKLKSKDWYKESLFEHRVDIYSGWSYNKSIKVSVPSLKQIVTNKIFNKKEQLLLQQRKFYTQYCINKGISFKLVQTKWEEPFDKDWFDKECKRRNISITDNDNNYVCKHCEKFIEGLALLSNILNNIISAAYRRNRQQSEENYQKALVEANKIVTVDDWRKNKHVKAVEVEYEHWAPTRNGCGRWVTRTVRTHFCFPTPKLKLNLSNNNEILTSLGARVTLASAIIMWRYFYKRIETENPTNQEIHIDFKQYDYKVGIYPLYEIGYDINKYSDIVGWDWYVQIGCHKIYISDVVDFINYYHLEDKFKIDDNVPFKSNIKQQTPLKLKIK